MNTKVNIGKATPEAYKALMDLSAYVATTGLQPIHMELIKIRASQINGCAFCINMHTTEARKMGETEQRIYLLSAWRESILFTEEEKAILALTEEVTNIQNHISDATYQNAAKLFDENYLSHIIMMIISINSWNRFAIASGMHA